MARITNIKLRRGTTASWSSANPVLDAGEVAWDSTVGKFKIGDAATAWNSLAYVGDAGLALKANLASPAFTGTPTGITKAHVGLGSVDNTADTAKPVSTAQQTALNLKVNSSLIGVANGVAGLGSDGKVPSGQLPAGVIPTYGYLIATFGGNGIFHEELCLYYSADGTTAVGGSNNPVYKPSSTGLSLRDPSVKNINGIWYVAYTANNGYSKTLEVASSTDLIKWTLIATIDVSAATSLNQSWAPEIVQDTNGDVYLFFANVTSGNAASMWHVKASDAALTTWGAPVKLSFTADPSFAIDAVPIKKNSTWYLFYSQNGSIERANASSVIGPYTIDKTGDWAGWGTNIEGPGVILLPDNTTYRMYVDKYVAGTGYSYSESTDLNTWSALTQVVVGKDAAQGQVLRHGSFIPLTSQLQMLQALQATMGVAQVPRFVEYDETQTGVPANTTWGPGMLDVSGRTTDVMMCHWSNNDELTFDADGVYHVEWLVDLGGVTTTGRTWMELQDLGRSLPYAHISVVNGEAWASVSTTAFMGVGGVMKFMYMQNTGGTRTVRNIVKVHRMTSS